MMQGVLNSTDVVGAMWSYIAYSGVLMFTDRIDLAAFLSECENTIELALTNSNRNLMGPHHGHDPEPWGVGPTTFSMENGWDENNQCGGYVNRYAFVRFGIDA